MKHLITKADMAKLTELSIKKYNHTELQMLELAGQSSGQLIVKLYALKKYKKILVVAGGGNNGAGGLSTAKKLLSLGYDVEIFLTTKLLNKNGKHYLKTLKALKAPFVKYIDPTEKYYDLILDAMIGYGLRGDLRSPAVEYVASINESQAKKISLGNPTGLSIDTGKPAAVAIKSDLTIMTGAEKQGLFTKNASEYIKNLELIDVGIPKKTYEDLDIKYPFL